MDRWKFYELRTLVGETVEEGFRTKAEAKQRRKARNSVSSHANEVHVSRGIGRPRGPSIRSTN